MKAKSIIISSALIAVAIVILGLALKSGIDRFSDRDRAVTVRGLCEKEVRANKVTWPIVTKEMGNDLASIYDKIQRNNATIIQFLKSNGLSDNEIAVNPPKVYDQMADRYNSQNIQYRYQVTNVLVVTSSQIDLVRQLINKQTDLMQKGIAVVAGDYTYEIQYEYTELNTIKPEMIAEATANAREAADKFASDSHSKLGKIKTASQGQFSINDRDQYTPDIKTVRIVTYITYYLQD
ncbi:MAG: SIMPL domain-containing protein [Muribaculaceae bacterium]|nr:SIMPL domain-containing protein [Muribaculaceae bacterium]MDE6196639.1 SIMPL domain-containing protein [Muribaculaceae bacterium]